MACHTASPQLFDTLGQLCKGTIVVNDDLSTFNTLALRHLRDNPGPDRGMIQVAIL